ncbi:Cytidine and deoxycytidylate deaminase domain [Dillenia turbinata]|uniref:Riboflavin biosynthesis protein PYRD, chloroplastic n=1 Tax=Dillenia turbinata TaxID=194707 RepID=A0AAN8Z493_9MAGN
MNLQTFSIPKCYFGRPLSSIDSTFPSGFVNLRERVSESQNFSRLDYGSVNLRCEVLSGRDDGFYMRRCVEIAKKAIGCTSPNPMVGCVVAKDGEIVGEGFHPKAGQPHAEVFALRDAGELAENATAYVSLEPCNHYGRTPPCTEALIKAKVKKVVVGMVDPNPIVASKGVDRLRDAGIDVTVGVEEALCKKLNEAYIHRMLTGKPFVTLRYSLSVNGHIVDELGEGAKESGGYYSKLLQEHDAVIVFPTLFSDVSFPSSEEPDANQPLQIVITKSPISAVQSFTTKTSTKAILFTEKEATMEIGTAQKDVETVVLDTINLEAILEYCYRQGLCSVLLDLTGNFSDFGELLKESLVQNMIQKVIIEVLPLWHGTEEVSLQLGLKNLGKTLMLKNLTSRMSNKGLVLEGYF